MLPDSSSSVPAGKTDITWMMLDAGAETDVVNSVGRTAAQMAAFVGASGCGVRLFTHESSVLQSCLLMVTKTRDNTLSLLVRNIWSLISILMKYAIKMFLLVLV